MGKGSASSSEGALFVEGRKWNNGENGKPKSGSRSREGKGRNSDSKPGSGLGPSSESRKSRGNAVGYVYTKVYLYIFFVMEATAGGIGSLPKMVETEGSTFDSASSEKDEMDADVDFVHGASTEMDEEFLAESSTSEENTGFLVIGEDSCTSADSDGSSYSGSDIDEEVAADYFEGIGRAYNIVNVGGTEKVWYEEARLRKKKSRGRSQIFSCKCAWSSALDDLVLVKDPRTVSGRKKQVARFRQSWPSEGRKNKNFRKIPGQHSCDIESRGEKKNHCKEMITAKRLDRMIRHGVDLQQINSKLQQMIVLRFVTVIRTQNTCMPSPIDKIRMEKLIGADHEDADFMVSDKMCVKADRDGNATSNFQSSLRKSSRNTSTQRERITGGGLGKDGQGMAQPIEVFRRPKSLGLGAYVPETSDGSTNMQIQPMSLGSGRKSSGKNEKLARKKLKYLAVSKCIARGLDRR
ncbi:unnamed protein product [Fraxinus pennsylvanica]|uniref:G-patch domain-containing protein n=1 Tax=Fraxinus pennsylvanica TaxID=56036 RepID=A0AAD2DQV1_9LAMI|nr:unnamed protein product [Fraxinus pennsylvanica]